MSQQHVALILAKSGSIGLPGKNLYPFQGRPLLEHTIEDLNASNCFDSIYVSSNGDDILNVASDAGASIIKRDQVLADNDRYIDAVNFSIEQIPNSPKTITIVQVVQPVREAGLMRRMLDQHRAGVDSVVTVTKFESSYNWIFAKNDATQHLAPVDGIDYQNDVARRDDLFIIDNAVVSFTYESWQTSKGITAWPYLGQVIIGVEQNFINNNYKIDINTADDAEWFDYISGFEAWKKQRDKERAGQ